MASKIGAATDRVALIEALRLEPYKFGFHAALRRIESVYADKPRIGTSLRPADDAVRFRQAPSLSFAPSTLSSFIPRSDHQPPQLSVLFFGLFGPNGPLPLHLTEHALERLRDHGDATFIRFIDVFHHRLLSLFYRAWATAQPTANLDRPDTDRFSTYLGALFGVGMKSLCHRDAMPDRAKLFYAGRLACQTHNAEGLRAVLNDFFRLPIQIRQFVGHWIQLPTPSLCRLGRSRTNATLGKTATIGTRVWDCQHKFRIVIGPVGLSDYLRFLPIGNTLALLVAFVRNYIGDELEWDVKLILRSEEVPSVNLGKAGWLGWTSWLGKRGEREDADDLLLDAFAQIRAT